MDLGIKGRRAIVCASSRGLGRACATSLAREGCFIVVNGIDSDRVANVAAEMRRNTGAEVIAVAADINTGQGRAALLEACPAPDILVNNNAGPPTGNLEEWDESHWHAALDANLLAPVFLIRAVLPGMRQRKFGRIVNITSALVKSPRSPFGLSAAARTGLTALSKTISRQAAIDNVTVNNLLPEGFDTDRQHAIAQRRMVVENISYEEARARIASELATKRLGRPEELGDACAYLCSAQAGFISGQNLMVDGGTYEGLI
jgi:3-oxoacyl-[acyl-carrier protein] reductase